MVNANTQPKLQAIKWLTLAANQGLAASQHSLAYMAFHKVTTHAHTHTHTQLHIRTHSHACAHAHTHTHTHTNHKHTHTRTRTMFV